MDLDQPRKRGLFAQCSFVIVRSAELSDDDAKEVRHASWELDSATVELTD